MSKRIYGIPVLALMILLPIAVILVGMYGSEPRDSVLLAYMIASQYFTLLIVIYGLWNIDYGLNRKTSSHKSPFCTGIFVLILAGMMMYLIFGMTSSSYFYFDIYIRYYLQGYNTYFYSGITVIFGMVILLVVFKNKWLSKNVSTP